MRFLQLLAIAGSVCLAAPSLGQSKHVVHEKRESRPHQWMKRDRAAGDYVLPIRIALRQKNLENAEKYIYDVSDPTSPNYGSSSSPIPTFFH